MEVPVIDLGVFFKYKESLTPTAEESPYEHEYHEECKKAALALSEYGR